MMKIKCMAVLWGVLLLSGFSYAESEPADSQLIRSGYKITLSENKNAIFVAGKFNHGISADVINLYLANQDTVKSIMYSSSGGKLHESVTLYQLAQDHNLNTYAINYCFSACTTAFVGGQNRISLMQTKFGFHKFGAKAFKDIEPDNVVIVEAQNRNSSLFQEQGVNKEFLSQIYRADHADMWNPNLVELLKGNVVHKFIQDLKLIPDFDITNKQLYPEI